MSGRRERETVEGETVGELSYVYAVCRPFDGPLPDITGVADTSPRQVADDGLVAVVGHVPEKDFAEAALRERLEGLDWVSATARRHEAVVAALMTVTSPLPLRLGTVFRDETGVRGMLRTQENRFRRLLGRLDGRIEWGVKVYLDLPERTSQTEPKRAATGRDYLRQRSHRHTEQEATWRGAEAFSEALHGALAAHAVDARLHRPQGAALSGARGRNVLNAAYLVDRAQSDAFAEAVDERSRAADAPPGLCAELTGPWAPYSFTGDEEPSHDDGCGERR